MFGLQPLLDAAIVSFRLLVSFKYISKSSYIYDSCLSAASLSQKNNVHLLLFMPLCPPRTSHYYTRIFKFCCHIILQGTVCPWFHYLLGILKFFLPDIAKRTSWLTCPGACPGLIGDVGVGETDPPAIWLTFGNDPPYLKKT